MGFKVAPQERERSEEEMKIRRRFDSNQWSQRVLPPLHPTLKPEDSNRYHAENADKPQSQHWLRKVLRDRSETVLRSNEIVEGIEDVKDQIKMIRPWRGLQK